MRHKLGHRVACVAGLVALGVAAVNAAQTPPSVKGPWIGVWRLNPEKTAAANSQPPPKQPPAASTIFRMVAVRDDVFKYTVESQAAGGGSPAVRAELIGRFDGKDYIEIGNPGADTNRFRLIDSRTYEVIDTKDGKDLLTIRVAISPDGRTRTSEAKGRTVTGDPVHRFSVYERIE